MTLGLERFNSEEKPPLVAVDIAIFNEKGEVLLGKRKGKTAASGQWNFPGGHVRRGEKLEEAAEREIKEELGDQIKIEVSNKVIGVVQNNLPPHYIPHVIIVLEGYHLAGEPRLMEPDKCEEWRWFSIDQLSESTFAEVEQALINRSSEGVKIGVNWRNG